MLQSAITNFLSDVHAPQWVGNCTMRYSLLARERIGAVLNPRFGRIGLVATLAGLSACGSGGAASPPVSVPATAHVKTFYDSEKWYPHESGPVLLGINGQPTDIRVGLWTTWHSPDQGNTKQFEKTYMNGTWNTNAYWREWNADTSLRFDWSDR